MLQIHTRKPGQGAEKSCCRQGTSWKLRQEPNTLLAWGHQRCFPRARCIARLTLKHVVCFHCFRPKRLPIALNRTKQPHYLTEYDISDQYPKTRDTDKFLLRLFCELRYFCCRMTQRINSFSAASQQKQSQYLAKVSCSAHCGNQPVWCLWIPEPL